MSLRSRLLLGLLAVNLVLLGVVQLSSYALQRDWLERNRLHYERWLYEYMLHSAYGRDVGISGGAVADATVRRVLESGLRLRFRDFFTDVLITSGASPQSAVDLNPMGALRRDPERFPLDEVRSGIRSAMEGRELIRAGGGFCVAIVDPDPKSGVERVVGGAWFVPKLPPPEELPGWVFTVPLLLGTCVLGLLAFWVIGRGLVRPLETFGATARRFGSGRYDVRMPWTRTRELEVFVEAFNAMAQRIEGHHTELAREVERATQEAKRKERALLQSARLASIGTLAAGIAHEINNPIGGMLNAVRRLQRLEGLGDRDRLYLELIRDGLERVGAIARRLLDFTPRELKAVPFRLRDAVSGAHALVEHRIARQGADFVERVAEDLPPLHGDPHAFQQVLLNLLLNSLDALEGRAGGRIAVAAAPVEGGIEVVVEDDGPGLAPELLGRVMDPFFSSKARPDASGLGMFISYSIIRDHGGRMEVESDLGAGFRTRIFVPTEYTPGPGSNGDHAA